MTNMPWRISIDAGGTFTDCVGEDPQGRLRVCKVLSSGVVRLRGSCVREGVRLVRAQRAMRGMRVRIDADARTWTVVSVRDDVLVLDRWDGGKPNRQCVVEIGSEEAAPLLGTRLLTDTACDEALAPMIMRLATTRATNALLERRLPRVGLFVSEGFGDLLLIGDQRRSDLFRVRIVRPPPLTEFVYEVSGRLDARGHEVRSPDRSQWSEAIARAIKDGCEIFAICLMHAWANDAHERALEESMRACGGPPVVRSSDIAARIGYWARGQTACVEAALEPVLGAYLAEIEGCVGSGRVRVLTSSGGLRPVSSFRKVDALVSGPAGGVLGALAEGRRLGMDRIISFDMGGTSTDVARCDGDVPRTPRHEVGGVGVLREAVAIETVAAGGGSICEVLDGRVRVGPRSAGADPGPACYGRGGPLTLTDVNLLLGRIDPARFEIPLDMEAARRRLGDLRSALARQQEGEVPNDEALLSGLLAIADERMSNAIGRISVRQGYDPRNYVLVAFGGAGGQHACAVGDRLGITRVLVPARASVLSAVGVGAARLERSQIRQVLRPLDVLGDQGLREIREELRHACVEALRGDGAGGKYLCTCEVRLRRQGQENTIGVVLGPDDGVTQISRRFRERERAMFGACGTHSIEVESLIVRVCENNEEIEPDEPIGVIRVCTPVRSAQVFDGHAWCEVGVFERDELACGDAIVGPALVREASTSIWISRGWRGVMQRSKALLLERVEKADTPAVTDGTLGREIVVRRLESICEHMGEALRRMSVSVNVRERMDYSCGVLDTQGRLIASAPHIPVHLGALGACVRRVVKVLGPFDEGDIAITNHPAFGGSHLPDVTVVQGVHDARGTLIGYVGSRAHHAEIGGISPGSMPARAQHLAEEGVVIPAMFLVRRGQAYWERLERMLRDTAYPSRCPEDNLADLRAQVAAGRLAGEQMRLLHAEIGSLRLGEAMDWIVAHTRGLVREAVRGLGPMCRSCTVYLDEGDAIRVQISIVDETLLVDLRETDDQRRDGLNAPLSVTRSAVAYVVRLLLGREVALNDGLLDDVVVRTRPGSLLDPAFHEDPARCPPVSAGNVEISQLLVEAMIGALELCASSQGTMNNLILGNDTFGLYETIGGGSGAGDGFCGCDAVHSHMTNTAIGDAEVVEQRVPIRIERFAVRRGSGGIGAFRGGDGIVRTIRALTPMELTVVTQRRVHPPFGMRGGRTGALGAQRVIRADGTEDVLASSDHALLETGDCVEMSTPGGGGWGTPPQDS